MSRKGIATWLLLCGLAPPMAGAAAGMPEDDRQRVLALLAGEVPAVRLRDEAVFLAGDLAAVGLPGGVESAVYLFERPADDAEGWRAVARITAPGEEHFGDAVLLSPGAVLVAAPDVAGAGLGPGATYVFQRNVGGKNRWGLVARLALHDYPPPGSIKVQQLAESPPIAGSAAPPPAPPPAMAPPPTAAEEVPPPPIATTPPPVTAPPPIADPPPPMNLPEPSADPPVVADPPPMNVPEPTTDVAETPMTVPDPPADVTEPPPDADPPPMNVPEPTEEAVPPSAATAMPSPPTAVPPEIEEADEEPDPAAEQAASHDDRPASGGALRYIAIANMREKPRALALAESLRERGYASEVHRNHRDFFVVTLARLPFAEAQRKRDEAVAAGDIPEDAYLLVGSGFREQISP